MTGLSGKFILGSLSQVPPGEGRVFKIEGAEIAVFHDRDGRIYASESKCPHQQGPLADGLVGGGKVICPLHEKTFDLTSGISTNSDCKIKTYQVKLTKDQTIVLELTSSTAMESKLLEFT